MLGNAWRAQPNIRVDGAREQIGVLQDHAEMPAEIYQIKGTHIDAPDSNSAALHIIEAKQQIHQRGLARTRVANDSDGLGRLNTKADVL